MDDWIYVILCLWFYLFGFWTAFYLLWFYYRDKRLSTRERLYSRLHAKNKQEGEG